MIGTKTAHRELFENHNLGAVLILDREEGLNGTSIDHPRWVNAGNCGMLDCMSFSVRVFPTAFKEG